MIPVTILDLGGTRDVHLVGVGGPGMGALAQVLAEMGHRVTGCDTRSTAVTRRLASIGVGIQSGNDATHLDGRDLVSWSPAVRADHPERRPTHGVQQATRAELLAGICGMKESIGVAGTHGKTTTAALLRAMLDAAGFDPSFVIGADVVGLGTGAGWRSGQHLVVEADESDGTHATLPLAGAIVTNVDVDHLDHYGSEAALVDSFAEMTARISGPLVLSADDERCSALAGGGVRTTFGFSESADLRAIDVAADGRRMRCRVRVGSDAATREVVLPLQGRHNVANFLAALAMARALHVETDVAVDAAERFEGVARRLESRGSSGGIEFVDDYAHLPAEIEAALAAVRTARPDARVVAVFQPNRYHRVRSMAPAYAASFESADHVVITEIYPSGTDPIPGVSGLLVHDAVSARHGAVNWCAERGDVVAHLVATLRPGDVCVSMGCGDIETLPDEVMGALEARA